MLVGLVGLVWWLQCLCIKYCPVASGACSGMQH